MAVVDTSSTVQNDEFSFFWTIQNLSYCTVKKGHAIMSPTFKMDQDEKGKYNLKLYLKGTLESDGITVSLYSENGKCAKKSELMIYIGTVRNVLKNVCRSMGYSDGKHSTSEHMYRCATRLKDLYNKGFLKTDCKNDCLTVGCRIWEWEKEPYAPDEPLPSRQCHVRTTIVVEKNTCNWTLENFLELIKSKPATRQSSLSSEIAFFPLELGSTGEVFAEDKLQNIKPVELVKKCLFSTCKMSLLDIDGQPVYSIKDEHWFEASEEEQIWKLSCIPMDKLLCRKELYLSNGTLRLRCEFAISSDATYNEVENDDSGISHLSFFKNCKPEENSNVAGNLKDNLERFYTEGKFSDLTIRAPNKEFKVHKAILCARSEVFSAMFENDLEENQTGVVKIEDVDGDTVSKMLMFLYTDTIGTNLDFQTASRLYFAADKYRIEALKRKCADFFKRVFALTNVCDVLVLADTHKDQELKSSAMNFIFKHSGEVMDSDEWKKFMQNNVQLASETMHALLKKF